MHIKLVRFCTKPHFESENFGTQKWPNLSQVIS